MRFEVCKFVRTQELACKDNNYLRFDNLQFTIFLQKGYKNGREAALCSFPPCGSHLILFLRMLTSIQQSCF